MKMKRMKARLRRALEGKKEQDILHNYEVTLAGVTFTI